MEKYKKRRRRSGFMLCSRDLKLQKVESQGKNEIKDDARCDEKVAAFQTRNPLRRSCC